MAAVTPIVKMKRVDCPAENRTRSGYTGICGAFLFEADPDFKGRIIKKCWRCHSYIEITDLDRPIVLSGYESANSRTFLMNKR